jgi:hypothetical protein
LLIIQFSCLGNANTNAANIQAAIQPQAQSQIQESSPNQPQIQQQQPQSQSTHIQTPQQQPRPQQTQLQQQVQHVQHMQSMPVQQVQQIAQHQPIPQQQQQQQIINQPAATITDRQVSIQIKLPVHGNLPERLINVHVPASAIQGRIEIYHLPSPPIDI